MRIASTKNQPFTNPKNNITNTVRCGTSTFKDKTKILTSQDQVLVNNGNINKNNLLGGFKREVQHFGISAIKG